MHRIKTTSGAPFSEALVLIFLNAFRASLTGVATNVPVRGGIFSSNITWFRRTLVDRSERDRFRLNALTPHAARDIGRTGIVGPLGGVKH